MQQEEWLVHFAARGAMDIEHLGYKTGILLRDKGWVNDPADIYTLTADQLVELPGFKERSVGNLLGAIGASKDRPIWRLLVGLNIRHVGSHVAQVLARAFGSIDAIAAASVEEIDAVEEIGPEIAQSVHVWFQDDVNRSLVQRLREAGVRMADEPAKVTAGGALSGKTIVLTGGMKAMSRDEATRRAQEAGARVASSVSKNTDFVVAGENPGSKYERALQVGVEIVDEEEFLRRLEG